MGVVDESFENGIGDRRVGSHFMPVLHIDLTGDDRAAPTLPGIEDLQQVGPVRPSRWSAPSLGHRVLFLNAQREHDRDAA